MARLQVDTTLGDPGYGQRSPTEMGGRKVHHEGHEEHEGWSSTTFPIA